VKGALPDALVTVVGCNSRIDARLFLCVHLTR
jgi:hypothetical protein